MQGFEKIKAQILADANAERERILDAAKAEAGEIARTYSRTADAMGLEALQKGVAEVTAAEARSLHNSEGGVKIAMLEKKQELIERAFVTAEKDLLNLKSDDMLLVLLGLGKGLSEKSGEIVMNEKDRELFGEQLAKQLSKNTGGKFTLAKDVANISGGFILRGGKIEVNCGFDRLFDRARQELSGEIASILFEG